MFYEIDDRNKIDRVTGINKTHILQHTTQLVYITAKLNHLLFCNNLYDKSKRKQFSVKVSSLLI